MFYIVIVLLLLITFGILFYSKYSFLKDINEKLNISLNKIKELVFFKESKIKEILDLINDDKYNYRYEHIDLDFVNKENEIFILFWDLKKDLKNNKKVKNIIIDVEKNENDLEGLKDYYNCNVNLYNEIYEKMPFNILFKLFKFENKKLFESKKIEDFEILKD